jgi:hypothetical protein
VARVEVNQVLTIEPTYTIEKHKRATPFKRPEDADHFFKPGYRRMEEAMLICRTQWGAVHSGLFTRWARLRSLDRGFEH